MADNKAIVVKAFIKAVQHSETCDPELRRRLLRNRHPKIELFLQNLAIQVTQVQGMRLSQRKPLFGERTIQSLVTDMTEVFIKNIMAEAQRMYESDLAKSLREKEAQAIKDMESTLAGKPAGAFEEMGLQVGTDKVETV